MKVKEASVKFNLAEKDIVDYEAKGFIKRCGTEYTEEDFQHLGLIRSLIKIGMKESEINKYLKLLENAGTEKAALPEYISLLVLVRSQSTRKIWTSTSDLIH